MADIKLFEVNKKVHELRSFSFDLEVNLQRLVESNMLVFFGIDFVASEHSFNGGRIDSLGIDENNCPVIFEYKRSINENVINQGLYYLEWLLDHKADFELLILKKYGEERAQNIEWRNPLVYCIANKFTKYDVNAVKQMQRNIYLIEYTRFEQDLVVFDFLNLDLKLHNITKSESIEGSKIKKNWRTVEERMDTLRPTLKPILEDLRKYILALGDDITEIILKQYIAYKKSRNVITVDLTNEKIQIYLHLNPEVINLEKGFSRDMRGIGHFGTGNVEVVIQSSEDFNRAKKLIDQAYNENWLLI